MNNKENLRAVRAWLKKILGIVDREERKRKLEEFYKLTEQTREKILQLHKDTVMLSGKSVKNGKTINNSKSVQANRQ